MSHPDRRLHGIIEDVSPVDMICVSVTIYGMGHGIIGDASDDGFKLVSKSWGTVYKYDSVGADEEHGLVESIRDEVGAVTKFFEIVAGLGTDHKYYSLLGDWKIFKVI